MAANEKNINGGLTRIKFPNLDEGEFGKSLADQFKNIDLNFQKLGNLNLNKGEDGAGCTYVNYNLNSIFFYWTGYSDNSGEHTELSTKDDAKKEDIRPHVERQNFRGFRDFILSKANPLYDRMVQLKKEVDADIQEFIDLTNGTEEEYVRMCAYLLFGQPMVFDHYKKDPETCSLFGALKSEYEGAKPASIEGTTYHPMWLLDWWNAKYKTDITATDQAVYAAGDERVDLFLTHMQLFDPGRITVAVAPALDNDKYKVGNYHPVGSLAYVYLDPRFRNHATGEDVDSDQWSGQSEISCVLYWSPRPLGHMHITSHDGSWDDHTCTGGFKVVNLFPQMYFDGTGFYWKINGTETKIPVTGRPGTDGKSSQFVVVERIGNIKDAVYNSCCYDDQSKLWGPWPLKKTTFYEEWLGYEKLIRTTHSGRAARNIDNNAYENVQAWVTDHINAHFDITKAETFETTNGVASVEVNAEEGWLPDATGFNSTEILHLYRIWGIVGRECFWRVKDGAKQRSLDEEGYIPFRLNDPSYSKYNFNDDDAVELITNGATQDQMKALDGAPCIVVADPAYVYDRTNTTVWFSTLKAVKASANKDDHNIMLVAYCGDENQMTTEIDDHGMAGIMQHLDAYTYKSTGSNRNKPRGLMLPIGSAEVTESGVASDVYGSHLIHSDLGGFKTREQHTYETDKGSISEWCGVPKTPEDAQRDINGDTMRSNNKKLTQPLDMPKDSQFLEVVGKRFMHIGSVDDFRTLDYVPGPLNNPVEYSPATPGRRTDHTYLKAGLYGKAPSVPYGTAGFFGYDKANEWFKGSELHVDEPVTITRYRDLQRKGTLLHVEGDAVIGPHKHVNFPDQFLHNHRDGGLFVQSTLTNELIEDVDGIWGHSVFNKAFGEGILPVFRPYTRDIRSSSDDYEDWNTILGRTQSSDTRFHNGLLGAWDETGAEAYDSVSNKDGLAPDKEARASILADDMIGARMMLALDGFAIIDQRYIDKTGKLTVESTPFSVDHGGNIQTLGSEVRSNAQDTFWAFHTRWLHEGRAFGFSGEAPLGFQHTTIVSHNELMFGTTHQLYNILFDPENGGSLQEGFNHWRCANTKEYLSYKVGEGTVTTRIPSQLSAGYVVNIGYAKTDTEHKESFRTAFNTDTGLRITPKGDLMPFIIRMWCDLLYQEGALAVKGVHYMPVTTSFLSENYSGRYGINAEYGLVIGANGAAAGDPTITTLNQLKARYSAHETGKFTQLGSDDTLGTHNVIDGGKLKWRDGDINMFESIDPAETPIGIWSRPGILTEESLIAQKDLWVGRGASVRGQIRAMSFRRHANAWTNSLYERDWAFLLDTGLSSYTAPKHNKVEGNTWLAEKTPIIIDLGPKFREQRLMRLGSAHDVTLDSYSNPKVDFGGSDREICLFGKYPEIGKITQGTFEYLFDADKYNPGQWVLYSDGAFATLTIKILLNFHQTAGHGGNMFRKNSKYTGYGICVPYVDQEGGGIRTGGAMAYHGGGDTGKASRRDMLSTPVTCDGVKFLDKDGQPLKDFAPLLAIDEHVMSIKPSDIDHKTNNRWGDSWAGKDSDFQYGVTFRLERNLDGEPILQIARAAGATLMVHNTPNQYITVSFTYPLQKFYDAFQDFEHETVDLKTYYAYYLVKDAPVIKQTDEESGDEYVELDTTSSNFPFKISDCVEAFDGTTKQLSQTITPRDSEASSEELSSMISRLTSEELQYIICCEIKEPNVQNPHTSANARKTNIEWNIYASKSELESGEGYAKRYVCTDKAFATTNLGTSWFAGKSTNSDFLSKNIGVPGTIPSNAEKNSWDLTVERSGGLNIVTLRVAADYDGRAGQGCDYGGLVVDGMATSKFEYRNRPTNANLKLVDPDLAPPKYDLYYSIPGMKPYRTRNGGTWNNNSTRSKGVEGDGDKQDQYGTVFALKSTGEIEIVRTINPGCITDPRGYSGNGDQPYVMCRWVYPDTSAGGADAGLVTSYLYGWTTAATNNKPSGSVQGLSTTAITPDTTKRYIWIKTLKTSIKVTSASDNLWNTVEWKLFQEYSNAGSSGGDGTTDIDDNWMWTYIDGTNVSDKLGGWLNNTARSGLKDAIADVGDGESQYAQSNYGMATIERTGNTVKVSLLVTAYNTSASDLSHRSINFTCNPDGTNIKLIGTQIIQKQYSSGYYYADDTAGTGASWIGTELGSATPTATRPYVLSYANGSWAVVNKYVAPDSNRIYFLAQGTASNTSIANPPRVPSGFILGVKADGTVYAPNGVSNYCPAGWSGSTIPSSTINVVKGILSTCAPGKIPPPTYGYYKLLSIATSDLNTLANIRDEGTLSPAGSLTPNNILKMTSQFIDSLRVINACRWVKADYKTMASEANSPANINFNSETWWQKIETPQLFLGLMLKYLICNGTDYMGEQTYRERLGTIYSDNVGFVPGWWGMYAKCIGLTSCEITNELSTNEPTTNTGDNAKISLNFGGPFTATYQNITVHGCLAARCSGFEWPNAPSGYKYLANRFVIDTYGVNQSHMIPYMYEINGGVIVQHNKTGESWAIQYKNSVPTVKKII